MLNNMYTNYNGLMNLKDMIANNKNTQVVYEEKAVNVLNYDNVVNLRKANPVKVQKVEEPKEEVVVEEVVIAEEPKEEVVVEDNNNLVEDIMNELKEEGVINEEGQLINPKEEPKKEEVKVEEPKEEVVEDNDNLVKDVVNKFNEVADKELNELVDELVVENPKEEPKRVEVENKKIIKDKAIDSTINAVECIGKGCIEATKIVGAVSIAGGVIRGLGGGILEAIKARKFQPIVTGLTAVVSTFVGTVQSLVPIVAVGYGLKKLAKFIKKIANR